MHFDYGLFVEKVLCFLIAIFTIFIFVVIPIVISKNVEQIQKDEESKRKLAKNKIKELNNKIQIGITLQEFNNIIKEIYKLRSSINLICPPVKCIYSSVNIKKIRVGNYDGIVYYIFTFNKDILNSVETKHNKNEKVYITNAKDIGTYYTGPSMSFDLGNGMRMYI